MVEAFDAHSLPSGAMERLIRDRQNLSNAETEDFLRRVSESWSEGRSRLWQRDYSSVDAYLHSVEPNRDNWQAAVGDPNLAQLPPPEGEITWSPFIDNEEMLARWITLPISGGLRSRAILALPKERSGSHPLVIAQHGVGSSPEKVMGFDDPAGAYKAYGLELVRAGYAVLAHGSGGV